MYFCGMSLYAQRGVSAQKEEVHAATRNLGKGLFPHAFCKIYPDYLAHSDEFVNVMHADGAGTKSILAYLYWKETGDISVWRGIAQDAIVMNLDDLICAGIHDRIIFNSTIDRNKLLIPGAVLEEIIEGSRLFFDMLESHGIHISYLGGETADVGDVVRTVAVNGTMAARWPASQIVSNAGIRPGDVVVGLASFGKSHYESAENSGIGSNGLTSARHDVLSRYYAASYPMTFDAALDPAVVYAGRYRMTDLPAGCSQSIGELLLSPTRTFAPVMKKLLSEHFSLIHGLVHSSGGGQSKCLKYLPGPMKVVKDNLFEPPSVFRIIRECSGAPMREMMQVFNMGCRMEIFCDPADAPTVVSTAAAFGVGAQVIGRVEEADRKIVEIRHGGETVIFE